MYDIKNGHVKIANDLLEDICRLPLSGTGFRLVFWVIRNSYGYNRKNTRHTTIRQICKEVNIKSTAAVCCALNDLLSKKILIRGDSGELFFDKHKVFSVLKTEQLFSKPNKNLVLKTEQLVLKTEQLVLKTEQAECNYLKDNLKDREKDSSVPPHFSVVEEYCRERGGLVDAKRWFAHYEAVGWKIGRSLMVDWKAAVRKWEPASEVPAAGAAPASGGAVSRAAARESMRLQAEREFLHLNLVGGVCGFCGGVVEPVRGHDGRVLPGVFKNCTCAKFGRAWAALGGKS